MRTTTVWGGALVLACASLIAATGELQQPVAPGNPQRTQTPPGNEPSQPAVAAAQPKPATAVAEEKPLREALQAFVQSFNARDVEALAGLLTDDATVVDPDGADTRGKAAVA